MAINSSSTTGGGLEGVIAAIATAIDAASEPDCARSAALARFLLAHGCDGLNVLGTTGEATSSSVTQRMKVMSAYLADGLPLHRLMVGTPTPIQAQTIPIVLSRRDVIGIAQTGTGKTAAFALPILHHIFANRRRMERKCCRVLVISPTRELSGQILDSFRAYGRHLRINAALAIGGVPMGGQVRALLDGVDVLVATPGRLLDLVKGNALRLGESNFSCSTKPIECSIWASSTISVGSSRSCLATGRRYSFPLRCRTQSSSSHVRCCATR